MANFRLKSFSHAGVGLPRGLFILVCVPVLVLFFLRMPHSPVVLKAQKDVHLGCMDSIDKLNESACVPFQRSLFPSGFVFGTATAAYQIEGAAKEGGREQTIWDTFAHTPVSLYPLVMILNIPNGTLHCECTSVNTYITHCASKVRSQQAKRRSSRQMGVVDLQGKTLDGGHGDVASDQYHKYQDDIELMRQLNVDAYRFSIAWSRIIKIGSNGSSSGVNKEGVAYYNKLIDGLLKKGIQPYVALYHWDLPQALHNAFGGWLDEKIVEAYAVYAEACFAAFGDRVKNWITFNEPQQFSVLGYGMGVHAPGSCSNRAKCPEGNSAIDPYIVAHHVLLAHGAAVDIYKKKFKEEVQAWQGGMVGMSVDCEWGEPMTKSTADEAAAQRHNLFQLGWFLDPIYRGDYPAVMRRQVGNRLLKFSDDEIVQLRGSLDFIGLNHYTSRFITSGTVPENSIDTNHWQDQAIQSTVERNGSQIGEMAASPWLYIAPWGLERVLVWLTERYDRPILFVTENGMDDLEEAKPLEVMLNDTRRIQFYQDYLTSVLGALRKGADVRGYFAWSLMDNFEWAMGYTRRFGLYYVDYKDGQKRYPKESAKWFSLFLK